MAGKVGLIYKELIEHLKRLGNDEETIAKNRDLIYQLFYDDYPISHIDNMINHRVPNKVVIK